MAYYATTKLDQGLTELDVFATAKERNAWINEPIPESDEWYAEVGPRIAVTAQDAKAYERGYESVIIHGYKRVKTPEWLDTLTSPMSEQPRTQEHIYDLCLWECAR